MQFYNIKEEVKSIIMKSGFSHQFVWPVASNFISVGFVGKMKGFYYMISKVISSFIFL